MIDAYSKYLESDIEYVSYEDETEALQLMDSYYEYKQEKHYY